MIQAFGITKSILNCWYREEGVRDFAIFKAARGKLKRLELIIKDNGKYVWAFKEVVHETTAEEESILWDSEKGIWIPPKPHFTPFLGHLYGSYFSRRHAEIVSNIQWPICMDWIQENV